MASPPEAEPAAGGQAEVVALGPVHEVARAVAAAHLATALGLACTQAGAMPLADAAHMTGRGQHDAAALLADLIREREARPHPPALILALTEADLCLPALSYVFGQASVGGGAAVVSLARLRADGAQRGVVLARLAVLACHEAGHALGLTHCREEGCVMRFPSDLEALDLLSPQLCPACQGRLAVLRATGQAEQRTWLPQPL